MSTNIEQLNKELEEYRQLHQQALLDAERSTELARIATDEIKKAHDQLTMAQHQTDLDRNRIAALELRIAPASSFHTPVPQTNLSNQIQSAVPIDEQTMNTRIINALTELSREFDGRLNQMYQILTDDAVARDDRMLLNVQALITSSLGRNTLPNVATGPSGPQNILPVAPVSTGPPIPSFNMAASTTSPMILPASTAPAKSNPSERSIICKNCRSDQHDTLQCQLRTCYNCRDKGDHCIHPQSECKQRIQRENYIASVTQAAGKAAAAKAMQEVYLFYNDEDEEEYSDFSTEAP